MNAARETADGRKWAEFADTTLLLLAHGSRANDGSAAPARWHAARLRERGLFAAVRECFWQQEPWWAEVLAASRTPRVVVVPLFIGEGYFVDDVIPRALGLKSEGAVEYARVQGRGASVLIYTRPAGTHPGMTEVLLARAREVVTRHPFPRAPRPEELTLVVVGHGTGRTSASRSAVTRQVELIRARGEYAEVHGAFMEDDPRIGDVVAAARYRQVVVVPYFISDGLHVVEDIPVLLGESAGKVRARLEAGRSTWCNPTERQGKRIWYAPGIGFEPLLTEVILERVREAMRGKFKDQSSREAPGLQEVGPAQPMAGKASGAEVTAVNLVEPRRKGEAQSPHCGDNACGC